MKKEIVQYNVVTTNYEMYVESYTRGARDRDQQARREKIIFIEHLYFLLLIRLLYKVTNTM